MDRWKNKVAVVTGASAGIGAVVVKDLVNAGMITVGLARRVEKVHEIRNSLPINLKSRLHALKCDVTDEKEVKESFQWIEKNLGGPDVLVNNAGVLRQVALTDENNTKEMRETVDTNIMGVMFCTREAFKSMKTRKIDGHVVMINSIAGHEMPQFGPEFPPYNIYPATKHAVTAMVEMYRQEFERAGTNIKVSSISPGFVRTDIIPSSSNYSKLYEQFNMLKPEDISDAVLYVIGTPPHVQVHEMIIKPMGKQY